MLFVVPERGVTASESFKRGGVIDTNHAIGVRACRAIKECRAHHEGALLFSG